jgi:hypothetical protein
MRAAATTPEREEAVEAARRWMQLPQLPAQPPGVDAAQFDAAVRRADRGRREVEELLRPVDQQDDSPA